MQLNSIYSLLLELEPGALPPECLGGGTMSFVECEPRLRFLLEVQTALKLSQEDQATIQSLKKEIERAWKMVAKGLHITHTNSDLLILVVMFLEFNLSSFSL